MNSTPAAIPARWLKCLKTLKMGYDFSGIFTNEIGSDLIRDAKSKWHFIKAMKVDTPFLGLALINYVTPSFGWEKEYEEDYDIREEQHYRLEDEILDFSKKFSSATFVFIRVECFGGTCIYSGFSCKNGLLLSNPKNEDYKGSDDNIQNKKLIALFKDLNVKIPDTGYFEPFTRGYFER